MKHWASIPGGPALICCLSPAGTEDGRFAEEQSDVKWVREQMEKEHLACLGSSVAGSHPCRKCL